MFVPITDPNKAFALHQAGLLWYRGSITWVAGQYEPTQTCWDLPGNRRAFNECATEGTFGIVTEE